MRAQQQQKLLPKVGLARCTWGFDKLDEEVSELKEAWGKVIDRNRREMGDLLFSCVNLAGI